MTESTDFLSQSYWNNRYLDQETGWDIGCISTPLKAYFDQITKKDIKILIPGAGNAHEAIYLHQQQFTQIHVVDFAAQPLANIQTQHPSFPKEHLICSDFFEHTVQYDLIIEQTFFCALNPSLRPQYVAQMHQLLKPTGKLVGLLFDDVLPGNNPPFGGNKTEYKPLFENQFTINTMETAYNSIPPRKDRELFISLSPK
jgi:SAM-dependent methyltransferase